MPQDIYLLYIPNQGWGVFSPTTCPDVGAFPEHLYRHYEVPRNKYDPVFDKLRKIQENLVRNSTQPTKENQKEIFPELSDLLD